MVFVQRRWVLVMLATAMLVAAGCAGSKTPEPSPGPVAAQADVPPWARVPLEARSYLADVALYTSPGYLAYAHQLQPEALDLVVVTLEAVEVPQDLLPAHDALLGAYQTIAQGRRLMVDSIGDNLLQEEARSQIDFGRLGFHEHVQHVEAYLASYGVTP